jgi:hypothetical protein
VSGLHACPPSFVSARLRKRLVRAVVHGGLFVAIVFSGTFAAGRNGEGIQSGETVCACAAAGVDTPAEAGARGEEAAADLDSLVPPKAVKVERPKRGLHVLILGDSLALCGFGKTLDSKLRKLPQVESVSTYMACGSVPTTWLMTGPFANAKTSCGFWSIEGSTGKPLTEVRDTFGMEKGRRPGAHFVPKLEGVAASMPPDILVMQNGTNLLSLFADGQTILPARHGGQIRSYMSPFVQQLAQRLHSLKKVYWIAPPVSERVSSEVQDFLFKRMEAYASPLVEFIDSRKLIPPPYKNPMPDREHFIGKDMEVWAERVFKLMQEEIEAGTYNHRRAQAESAPGSNAGAELAAAAAPAARAGLRVRARLLAKSSPLPLEKIVPYQESMVGFLYRVEQVLSGAYAEKELLVMHPAHIAQIPEPLEKYAIGEVYPMDLIEFEGSPWEAIKRSEQTGRIELLPFIRKEDEARFPSGIR